MQRRSRDRMIHRFTGLTLLATFGSIAPLRADEGMWLFSDLPREQLKSRHEFEPSDDWARHLMLASVRFNVGGSASFVSSRGLVLTNHHVGADTLHKLSTPEHNYAEDGFYAKTLEEEISAPDLELNQLVAIADVTERVNAAVPAGMPAKEAFEARRAIMSTIEKESLDASGLRSDVVTLFGGAKYHLYQYKKYTDVRLVFAPEAAVAFFGGDADNFEYPRYCLDVCLFRVYEDGKPAEIEHFLQVNPAGAQDGDLVFVSGNPGRTQRIFTLDALKFQRDHYVPYVLGRLHRREVLYQQFGLEGKEQERRVRDDLFGVQNARKAYTGMRDGLQNPAFFAARQQEETAVRQAVAADPQLQPAAAAWTTVAEVQAKRAELLGRRASFDSRLYEIAEKLVFLAAEDQKPNAERLREYSEAARESLEQQLYSPAPIYEDLERAKLADSFAQFVEFRGGDDELVAEVFAGKGPQARAAELISVTQLAAVETRKQIAAGGPAAIAASSDPLIQLARRMEPLARELRKQQDELDELERQAYAQITTATYAVRGTDTYPDATFTLRLAFGLVQGYEENGQLVPPRTTLGGAFAHEANHGGAPPWQLPSGWHAARDRLDLETPYNFVNTADIIGGNSGSPVVDREGRLVGVIFDGNIQSLTGSYFYSDVADRAVSVHVAAVLESLRKIYGAERLADELGE